VNSSKTYFFVCGDTPGKRKRERERERKKERERERKRERERGGMRDGS
jgi:BRCT domain type II-containing protein